MMDAALCTQVDASRTALRKRCEPLTVQVSVDEGMPQAERFMQMDGHREDGHSSVLYHLFLSQASKWALPLPGVGCSVLSPARRHPRLVWTLSSSFDCASVCFALREAQVNQMATKALLPLSLSCASTAAARHAARRLWRLGHDHQHHRVPSGAAMPCTGSHPGPSCLCIIMESLAAVSTPPPIPTPILYHT
ncbi:hypothetical protein HBI56_194850 [Parastagonospora nodorum]|uniref:Uncharacterized protein n=1 Tax=Phaeosphaeria nodorum (strain SN15 / ATCC MYA-4574 / FGSC 10173) TaxID=321614 RepID=A0A7U2HWP0_PHANO|nr:hypothetical protein HBH56_206520 [Parastagonospora nodorum]QRC94695.1 hypothetical protein JI435_148540 [Parastagonospora nodorum SN15]KAH3923814.1 hypothetical protein HBH54_205390 [Parastagonospora nodorum]KAH3962339.1 hypothetical protein HBH51_176810 [Parastagonospora nodorum]KAH3967239.1 hypothetical protein HBH52_191030 [Parastagonospora nodorum]